MPSRLVVNASPLIFLTRVGLLEVLRETADEVWIPTAVIDEIARKGPGDPAAAALLTNSWLQPVSSSPTSVAFSAWNLGLGETAVLEVAHSLPGSVAVLDDRAARRLARDRGIPILGTLALVAAAKGIGLIPSVGPVIDQLRRSGMYLSDRLTRQLLEQAGESDDP